MNLPAMPSLPAPVRGFFSGYASIFNHPDAAGDVVTPGAFAASLRRRPARDVRLLYQHDSTRPVGVWLSLHEDSHGLFARGALLLDSFCGREGFAQLRGGAMDGLSIGFHVRKAQTCRRTGGRFLHEIDLIEISLVTFPAHTQARVQQIACEDGMPRPPARKAAPSPGDDASDLLDALKRAACHLSSLTHPCPIGV